ncbi:hypothetical protein AALO_G00293610 [Alosa alosa]|uniref:Uncharacterized protein n=1 Tax=Alosa alosa TaxID=278164 RepID=A0AAV6FHF2_9TELE|nr:hypothetical protein AALO_G00293610 [Alosa alosa]
MWDNHPLRTEGSMTPDQLWLMGIIYNPVPEPNFEGLDIPDIDWEDSGLIADAHSGIVVPRTECPLNDDQIAALEEAVNPTATSESFGWDIYLAALQFSQSLM